MAAIVAEADDAIISVREDLTIEIFNRGAERIFGYRADEILGRSLNLLIPERLREQHDRHMRDFARSRSRARHMGQRREIAARRKSGEEFAADASILALTIDGRITFTAILRDVSERKREAEALRLAKEEAEAANHTKSQFLTNMSHELRTPLNAVIGFSQMIRSHVHGPLGDPRYDGYVANILEAGEHLLNVINDILDMSRIEAGRTEPDLAEAAIHEIVASVMRVMGERVATAELRLSKKIEPHLPLLWADSRMVKQMLLNLVSNAIKFTPAGGEILIEACRTRDGGVALSVADTGIGMATADIPKALEPFGQIDATITRRHTGTGLGLALVRSMIELHGGTLSIESGVGAGTTVTLQFPAARGTADEDEHVTATPAPPGR